MINHAPDERTGADYPATRSGKPLHPGARWANNLRHWAVSRLLLYAAAVIIALIVSKLLTIPFIPAAASRFHAPLLLAANLASAVFLLCVYGYAVRLVERRGAREVDPRRGVGPFLIGLSVGTVLMSFILLILWGLGFAVVTAGDGTTGLAGVLTVCFAVAVLEELLLRAIVFRVVEEAAGTTAALVASALLFGLLHGLNPGATLFSSAAIAIEGGLLLAFAYMVTRSLWASIGIHMSWNFVQGGIFGANVSGFAPSHSLLRTALKGPGLLSGGLFGPEASVLSIGVCALASVLLAIIAIRRSEWQMRPWRMWLA